LKVFQRTAGNTITTDNVNVDL
jgi:hypothetical protein